MQELCLVVELSGGGLNIKIKGVFSVNLWPGGKFSSLTQFTALSTNQVPASREVGSKVTGSTPGGVTTINIDKALRLANVLTRRNSNREPDLGWRNYFSSFWISQMV